MTRKPRCSDLFGGDPKCTREPHPKGSSHSDGVRFWLYENEPEPFVAEWRRRVMDGHQSLARDETGRVAVSPHRRSWEADKTPWAPR